MRKLFVLLAVLFVFPVSYAVAGDDPLIVKASAHSVSDTLDRLQGIMKKKGITIFARVDHAGGAKKVGLELKSTQLLIFGNPKLGTPLMMSNQRIGIDLPLKALAWQDKDGKVWLAYTDPGYLKKKHGISDKDGVFKKMAGALNKLTDAAVKAAK